MLNKFEVRSPLDFASTKKSDGTEGLATTGSVDSSSVLSVKKSARTRLRVENTLVQSVEGFLRLWERPM